MYVWRQSSDSFLLLELAVEAAVLTNPVSDDEMELVVVQYITVVHTVVLKKKKPPRSF